MARTETRNFYTFFVRVFEVVDVVIRRWLVSDEILFVTQTTSLQPTQLNDLPINDFILFSLGETIWRISKQISKNFYTLCPKAIFLSFSYFPIFLFFFFLCKDRKKDQRTFVEKEETPLIENKTKQNKKGETKDDGSLVHRKLCVSVLCVSLSLSYHYYLCVKYIYYTWLYIDKKFTLYRISINFYLYMTW